MQHIRFVLLCIAELRLETPHSQVSSAPKKWVQMLHRQFIRGKTSYDAIARESFTHYFSNSQQMQSIAFHWLNWMVSLAKSKCLLELIPSSFVGIIFQLVKVFSCPPSMFLDVNGPTKGPQKLQVCLVHISSFCLQWEIAITQQLS